MISSERLRWWVVQRYGDFRWWLHLRVRPVGRRVAPWLAAMVPLRTLLRLRDVHDRRLQEARRRGDPRPAPPRLYRIARFRPIPPTVEVFTPPGRPDLRLVPAASPLALWAYWFGIDGLTASSPHGSQITIWEDLCAGAGSVVEIGAHIGTLTVPGARAATARYVAVEANPRTAEVLRRNLALNGLDRVEVVEAAAVADPSVASVELVNPAEDGFELSSSAQVRTATSVEGTTTVVPARSVLELVDGADVVKLDVEGLELELLTALEPWMARARPTLMIEVLDDKSSPLKDWVSGFAATNDYEIAAVTARGSTPVDHADLSVSTLWARFGSNDLVLTPRAR